MKARKPLEPDLPNYSSISLIPTIQPLMDYTSTPLLPSSFDLQAQGSLILDGLNFESVIGNLDCPAVSSVHSELTETATSGGYMDVCCCIESHTACLHRMYQWNTQQVDVPLDQVLILTRQAISSIEESIGCQACRERDTVWIYLFILHNVGGCFGRAFNCSAFDLQNLPVYFGNFQINTTGRESEIIAVAIRAELERSIDLLAVLDDQWRTLHQSQLNYSKTPESVALLSSNLREYFIQLKNKV
ncbi:hypothetical protein EJ07DRAFT_167552 [Lizonia empirigonia]|nr:hypothetical protein EJ07DRAFT_167552 [Lizonia empirigonia]